MKLPQIHGRGLRITRTGHAILRRIAAGTYKFSVRRGNSTRHGKAAKRK